MNDLRKIEYSNGKSIFNGLFHKWLIKIDSNNNEVAYALIEGEDGHMTEVIFEKVKFLTNTDKIIGGFKDIDDYYKREKELGK